MSAVPVLPPFAVSPPDLTEGSDASLEAALGRLQQFVSWRGEQDERTRSLHDLLAYDEIEATLISFIAGHRAVGARGVLVKYNTLKMIQARRDSLTYSRLAGAVEPLDFGIVFTIGQLAAREPR
jgi:hypothetical protein